MEIRKDNKIRTRSMPAENASEGGEGNMETMKGELGTRRLEKIIRKRSNAGAMLQTRKDTQCARVVGHKVKNAQVRRAYDIHAQYGDEARNVGVGTTRQDEARASMM